MDLSLEQNYRRSLMKAALNGNLVAQKKLKEEYKVWVFSNAAIGKPLEEPGLRHKANNGYVKTNHHSPAACD